jgi:LysM repeat protein
MAAQLHDANHPVMPEMIPYIVKPSDTLGRIASRYRCTSLGEIAALNDIRPPRYVIRVGQMIKIPTCE